MKIHNFNTIITFWLLYNKKVCTFLFVTFDPYYHLYDVLKFI